MANMTNFMALYLTFNLVFLGFTLAQPVAQPVCPLNQLQLQVCVRVLFIDILINPRRAAQCCTLLARLRPADLASACACDAARLSVLGGLVDVRVRLNQLLRLCQVASPPGFNCPLL